MSKFDDLYEGPAGFILAPFVAIFGVLYATVIKLLLLPIFIFWEFFPPRDTR